jgi:hypothetical protein
MKKFVWSPKLSQNQSPMAGAKAFEPLSGAGE